MAAAGGAAVDLEALINEFVADEERATLELPTGLTTDQRKHAKRYVDSLPELKRESYGFGEERRLHVFKKNQDRVRVKNTFIDGWEDANGGGGADAMFRSTPPGGPAALPSPAGAPVDLLERTLQRCLEGKAELGGSSSSGGASPSSPRPGADLGELPEGFKVRNTFIHIESVPVVERIVQSMPHGMFRQCLQAELSAQTPAIPEDPTASPPACPVAAPAPAAADGGDGALAPGTEVIIQGLVKLPDFNGLTGVVQSLDAETMRYDVLLDGPAGQCGWRWVKVKGENCRLRMPPPPLTAPKLAMEYLGDGLPDEAAARLADGVVPATPQWDEDFSCQAALDAQAAANAQPLRLNALV